MNERTARLREEARAGDGTFGQQLHTSPEATLPTEPATPEWVAALDPDGPWTQHAQTALAENRLDDLADYVRAITLADERRAQVERALSLNAEARRLAGRGKGDSELAHALRAGAKDLLSRPDRKAPPLASLSLQPMNRNVYAFLVHDRDDYDLNPPYQRGSVWTLEQRRAHFESLLRGLPTGSVIINDRWSGRGNTSEYSYAVVDGKQRIETLRAFHQGDFSLPADWFGDDDIISTDADGEVFWHGLSAVGKRTVQNLPFPVIEARVATVAEEARIFGLVNSGGTAQTPADLTRAQEVSTR